MESNWNYNIIKLNHNIYKKESIIMNNTNVPMQTNKESLFEKNIAVLDETSDRLARTTGSLCAVIDKLAGCVPEDPNCIDDRLDQAGVSGMMEAAVRRMVDRVNSIESQVNRLVDSNII